MAQVHYHSPYSVREGPEQNIEYAPAEFRAYAAPPNSAGAIETDGNMVSPIGAWAPKAKEEIGNTPDPQRIQHMARQDRNVPDGDPPTRWYSRLSRNLFARHSVESQDADGWTEQVRGSGEPTAIDPRRYPIANTRPTQAMAPRTYFFTRPMWGGSVSLTGEHFSMADHRRNYDILGMQPVRTWRNTYRKDPQPWDTDMVDEPADYPRGPAMTIQSIEVPLNRSSAYRLV